MSYRNILVIVDMQNDFVSPQGSMAIKGANRLVEPIEQLQLRYDWNYIYYLQDCHQKTHKSFIKNGGEFPSHCVSQTWGFQYSLKVLPELFANKNKDYFRFLPHYWLRNLWKGVDDNDLNYYCNFSEESGFKNEKLNFFLVGVATDYCVQAQYLHLTELFPKANIFIIDELTLPIKEKPKYPDWYITLDKLERFVSLFGSHKDIVWSFCRNNKNKWVGDNYIQEVLINNSENYLITTSLELNKEKRVSLLICKDTTEEEYHQIRTLFEI